MTAQTITYKPNLAHNKMTRAIGGQIDKLVDNITPRPCMVRSLALVLMGLTIPALMVLGWLPATLVLCFVGLALTATGAVTALINCGEI
jgi:hypothetical protein